MTSRPSLQLNGFIFSELFHSDGLNRLDQAFLAELTIKNANLHAKLLAYRKAPYDFTAVETSELLIDCAMILEDFLARLFHIEEAVAIAQAKTTSYNPIATFKKYFVLRRAKKEMLHAEKLPAFAELNAWLEKQLLNAPVRAEHKESAIALLGNYFLSDENHFANEIEKLVAWCTRALVSPDGQAVVADFVSFHLPKRLDYSQLVPTITNTNFLANTNSPTNQLAVPEENLFLRDGFKLTDTRMNANEVQNEVNYCIYCHDHEGDFCSKGFPEKKRDKKNNFNQQQTFKQNPLNVTLTGCPLEEKISEMQHLKREGYTLASLAMIMVDNPMCPATGHRICNDCMKACIYQKQDPVNVPQIETRVLSDVLALPWGVEIYDLLTRWNPLRSTQWAMKPYNYFKIMIAGMGPAGFTLAHHLLQEGCAVVGFDGLKIEPLANELLTQPIYAFADLVKPLDERLMAGFGGVAEYGITARWDKNFLQLIYLSLMRRPYFQVFGSVRFGGTIKVEDAWEMGFDHFVIAVGAGLPKALSIPGSLAPGMRQANDFLMALQLGNAAKPSSLTNLQIRLPAVVIGGGLTGVDAATELQAYYITQVEKILSRYETLIATHNEAHVLQQLKLAERKILTEFLQHGRALRDEREQAKIQNRPANFIKLIREWGGVSILYRRSLTDSPAYVHNHEELQKALAEGIYYLENLEPSEVILDEFGHAQKIICHRRIHENHEWITTDEEISLPARTILVATGTQPNTAYEFEHRGTFNRLNLQYQHYEDIDGELSVAHGIFHCKDSAFGAFTSYDKHKHRVSLIGDTHPVFHGSVVKAIASGMRTYPKIMAILPKKTQKNNNDHQYSVFAERMKNIFSARVQQIIRRTKNILELIIHAPLAAKHFKPGQFYRLQNFETYAHRLDHTLLQMEPLALIAAECNLQQGTLTFIITENSASAKLCATLQVGDPISLMGPTGVHAKIPTHHETVLIIGKQSSFAFLRSYGSALRAAQNRVIYCCQLESATEIYSQQQIENAADKIIWLIKNPGSFIARKNDEIVIGDDIISTLIDCAQQSIIPLADVDRIYVIGEAELLRTFQAARQTTLKDFLVKDPKIFGSVYGNMQCMLKGVCAQCLQWQIDPETGKRTKAVFACSWQDQPLEIIDVDHINDRQAQNSLLDQINQLWVDHLFAHYHVAHI